MIESQDSKSVTGTRRASRLSDGSSIRPLDFGLTYPGKKAANEILAGEKSVLTRCLSVASDNESPNRLYFGDNLRILRSLLEDPNVCGKVTLVYIDPPFATGSSFESRDAEAAYHDCVVGAEFLEFLRERIIVLRQLLAPTGSIYLHLDSKMAFPMKVIMDEVFGPTNFRNWITRKKSNRKNFTRKQYGNISDFILFYTKNGEYTWNRPHEQWTDEWLKREYQYIEEKTGRRYKKVPVHAPGVRNGETGKPWRGKTPPPGKHWQYPPATLDKLDANGEIYWSPTGNPRRKIYFDQSKGIPIQDIWLEFRDAHNQNIDVTGYPTEKNLDMLCQIVEASSNPGDLVLDAFVGSGTTIVAAEETSRRWIGIDSSPTAIETTIKRLAHGSEPMGDFVNGKKAKAKTASLFDHPSALRTSFDLYASDTTAGISENSLQAWAKLFRKGSALVSS